MSAVIPIATGLHPYDVRVGAGLLAECGPRLADLVPPGRALVVTDENVAPLYLDTVVASLSGAGFGPGDLIVPPGEETKTGETVQRLYRALVEMEADRTTAVVALGGGVVTDLAGFAAATYLRGISWMALPTTLLAQVDASVGGKTGVNLPEGKNLVGAFHQPAEVLADVGTLRTLEVRQLRNGLAEAVKTGAALDVSLFTLLESNAGEILRGDLEATTEVVARCVRAKADVVSRDEREAGPRRVLNFGHTAGHAVEAATGFGPVLHGEAVAVGMVAAARLSVLLGRLAEAEAERLVGLLRALGLPTGLDDLPEIPASEDLRAALRHDKKRRSGRQAVVLLAALGEAVIVEEAGDEELLGRLFG